MNEIAAPLPELPRPESRPGADVAASEPQVGWRHGVGSRNFLLLLSGAGLVLALVALAALWHLYQRADEVERELVRRQQAASEQAFEAGVLAKQAQEVVRDGAGRLALLETRLNEIALQRGQLEDLIQSLSRSRDENVVNDVEAALRVASQQVSITGSAEPLVAALRSAEDRLGRLSQPRLERVRRAIAHDLEKVRSANVTDVGVVLLRLDEVARALDELPLVSERPRRLTAPVSAPGGSKAASGAGGAAIAKAIGPFDGAVWARWWDNIWGQVQQLFSVHRMEHPEAALMSPEHGFFVRENIKLRLLNARLAILSRQTEGGKLDLQAVTGLVERYFDKGARATQATLESLKQVSQQISVKSVPLPDETFAAIAALSAGR